MDDFRLMCKFWWCYIEKCRLTIAKSKVSKVKDMLILMTLSLANPESCLKRQSYIQL